MKVKVRLQGDERAIAKLRDILLEAHPELILAKPRKGSNPKYKGRQKWASYGDYWFGKIRRNKSLFGE